MLRSSTIRRVSARVLAALALLTAAALSVIWVAGSRIWPADEATISRRIATDPAVLQAALARGEGDPEMRIGIIGDIQNGITELADVLDALRGERLDVILQLGDATNVGDPGRYAVLRHYFETRAQGIPVVAVPGNHDIEPDGRRGVWRAWVGPTQWRLDVRGWRILGIDDADGKITLASMELLRQAAADPPPRHGTMVAAHRPLAAPATTTTSVGPLAAQMASVKFDPPPRFTLSGHWHDTREHVDAAGTVHHLLGENCDRNSTGPESPVKYAVMTLAGDRATLDIREVPRRRLVADEFNRLAVGILYPPLREFRRFVWPAAAALAIAAGALAFASRRTAAPVPA